MPMEFANSAWSASGTIQLLTKDGPIAASARTNLAPLRFSDNRTGSVIKCVEPATNGVYWVGNAGYSHFCLWNGRIVGFCSVSMENLEISVSQRRPPRGSDGLSHIRAEAAKNEAFLIAAISEHQKVNLNDILGTGAFNIKEDARPPMPPMITKIVLEDSKCRISLKGFNEATSEIVFNEQFQPVSATLKGKIVFPRTSEKLPSK